MKHVLALIFSAIFTTATLAVELTATDFAKLPQVRDIVLSPSGKFVAMKMLIEGKPTLVVRSTEGNWKPVGRISVGEFFISRYDWVNDDRLIVWLRDTTSVKGLTMTYSRMVALDKDGGNPIAIKMKPNDYGYFRQYPEVVSWLPDDNEHILAALDNRGSTWEAPQVHKVNVYTGERDKVQENVHQITDWIVDNTGEVRVGVSVSKSNRNTDVTSYFKSSDGNWEVLQKADYFDHQRLTPFRFDRDDNNILLVASDELNKGKAHGDRKWYKYDMTAHEIIGEYQDVLLKSVKKEVEAIYEGETVSLVDVSRNRKHMIFELGSDIAPAKYIYLNLENPALVTVGKTFPQLESIQHAPMQEIEYSARDGLTIPAFLTLPVNGVEESDKVPLVVMPHGGPWSHDEWGFDNYVQFFAYKGYAVLQPQFRGSTGYGVEHEEAGYGEWGGAIQDDITDGVKFVLENYNIDKDRICIVGASFGGYAAAMGAAKTPELYRCAVSINGVLNLPKMISDARYMVYGNINKKVWNDRSDAKNYSPYHLVENIKAPMLIIASKQDSVVPYEHSKSFYKELKGEKVKVDYIEFKEGEHWRTYEPNEIKIFEALDSFLSKHLDK